MLHFVLPVSTYMHVMVTHIAGTSRTIANALFHSQMGCFKQLAPNAVHLLDPIPACPTAHSVLVTRCLSFTCWTYQAGLQSYFQFCNQFNISPFPTSSLTLHYFRMHIASRLSYKTIKIYLSGIHSEHLEWGHNDPTNDELLHLLCTGIKQSQGDTSRL